ncbi:uncharacterized protein [Panulirus ornatus]|uniref:uncharacterized protein n=1 Tax=Panulirus ornatus TaxID=150431 RepID=UPI003A851C2C
MSRIQRRLDVTMSQHTDTISDDRHPSYFSTKLRILLAGMVLIVALTAVTILFYTVLLISSISVAPTPEGFKGSRFKQIDEYPTVIGSSIESQFLTSEIHNCSLSNTTVVNIQWNNFAWQKVDNNRVYLYSSFYDARYIYFQNQYHYIRIIGMAVGKIQESYFCRIWYTQQQEPVIVKADTSEIWGQHWNQNPDPETYHTYLFSCPVPLKMHRKNLFPDFVSVSSQPCGSVSTKLPVHREGLLEWQNGGASKRYAVCVKGMDFEEDISIKLIEWLELLYILGVDQVFIYKYTIHQNVGKVLDYYARYGKVRVVSLSLPGDQPNEPKLRSLYLKKALWQKRRNELVPYNDCLYRNIYLYDYVIPLDIDEIIIPINSYTWFEMLLEFQRKSPKALKKYASFSAQNVYFLDVFNSTLDPEVPKYFYMLHHTVRSANFSIIGHSVKSFVSTKYSRTVFNHYTLEPLYSSMKTNKVMNTSIVQMNHYKKRCPREIYSQCKSKFLLYTMKDNVLSKYKKELIFRVKLVIKGTGLHV